MGRTVGLPIHLLYPFLAVILLAIAAFGSAEHVWYARAVTATLEVRFASTDYCGYRISNLIETAELGCVQRGFEWAVPVKYFGFPLPTDIAVNLSRVAVLSVVSFSLVLASGIWHAYSIRYSYRKSPAPNKDKLYSCGLVHIVSVFTCLIFTWCAFIAQAALVGNATKYSNDIVQVRGGQAVQSTGVAIYWGQSPWLVLGAAVTMLGWAYEAVRWRSTLAG